MLCGIPPRNKPDNLQTFFNFTMHTIGKVIAGEDRKASNVKCSLPFGNEVARAGINDFEAHGPILPHIRPADR